MEFTRDGKAPWGNSNQLALKLGISSCLHGVPARYDGTHRLESALLDAFGRFVKWIPVCPEMELGLGVPREMLRLEGATKSPRLVHVKSRRDITREMQDWARKKVEVLRADDLDGFVTKKNSPSCGLFGVRVFDEKGAVLGASRGFFADELARAFPLLPVEDEEKLRDPLVRDDFIERARAYRRFKLVTRIRSQASPPAE